jgi:hypothetical protein
VLCCGKIQNDCSEYFKTRQGLRQVAYLQCRLESIARRAKLRQRICVFRIPGDTEQRRESGDTEENPDCKYMLLRTAQTIAVGASFTSNKMHHLQTLDPPDPAVWQGDMDVDQKGVEPTPCV